MRLWRAHVSFGTFLLAIRVFSSSPGANASVVHVDDSASELVHDGSTWCAAFLHLQDALEVAAASGGAVTEIRVAQGVYKPDRGGNHILGDRLATFRLVKDSALRGGYAGCGAADPDARDVTAFETVLSGDLVGNDGPNFSNYADNAFHVVTNNDTAVTASTLFDGFTVRGGNANGTLAAKTDQGGGFHNHSGHHPLFDGGPTVANCLFKENWAANHGAVNDHGGMTLVNCEFRDNHAGMWGGGLYIHERLPTTVTACRFFNNHTDGTSGGGGGAVHEGTATFTDCVFEGNTSSANGGGMYNHGGASPVLTRCRFEGNTALRGGGMFNAEASQVTMDDCEFYGNRATAFYPEDRLGGGVYHTEGSVLTLTRCTFGRLGLGNAGNNAFFGGAIYSDGSQVWSSDGVFDNNRTPTAGEQNPSGEWIHPAGGGIYATAASVLEINSTEFNRNHANRYGGAIYADLDTSVVLNQCLLTNNGAYYGSAVLDSVNVLVSDCTFHLGSGTYGAAMLVRGDSRGTIRRSLFLENTAGGWHGFGGALNLAGEDFTIADCVFAGNHANGGGGAIRSSAAVLRIMNSVFSKNSSDERGGALLQQAENFQGEPFTAELTISNCTFLANTAPVGSTVAQESIGYIMDNDVQIRNSILWDGADSISIGAQSVDHLAVEFSNVQGGWAGNGNIDLDPQLVDPDGPDNVLGTLDDDVRPATISPCVNVGSNALISADAADLDGDGNTAEPLPFDLDGHLRALGTVDMGAYEFTADCNQDGVPDHCNIACDPPGGYCDVGGCGTSGDCNGDGTLDECETDCQGNGVPDRCECLSATASMPEPVITTKNRYIAFVPGDACLRTALRVRLAELPPPWNQPPPAGALGEIQWVGPPRWVSTLSSMTDATPPAVAMAPLACQPHYEDWSAWGALHVYGAAVVPNARYEVAAIHEGCPMDEADFSAALSVETETVWCDVSAPFGGSAQPNFGDISAVVDKFRDAPGAVGKTQADLEPNVPNQRVNFGDISVAVGAFRGLAYAFAGPAGCP